MDKGSNSKKMTPERVAALEGMPGWAWEFKDAAWKEKRTAVAAYVAAPPHSHSSGLGKWVTKQRHAKRAMDAGRNRNKMTPERVAALEAVPLWTWTAAAAAGGAPAPAAEHHPPAPAAPAPAPAAPAPVPAAPEPAPAQADSAAEVLNRAGPSLEHLAAVANIERLKRRKVEAAPRPPAPAPLKVRARAPLDESGVIAALAAAALPPAPAAAQPEVVDLTDEEPAPAPAPAPPPAPALSLAAVLADCGVPALAAAEYLLLFERLGVDSPADLAAAFSDPAFAELYDALKAGVKVGHLLRMKASLAAAP